MLLICVFFFFKQKTAYEMRISDWSSDVCSSDLLPLCGSVVPSGPLGIEPDMLPSAAGPVIVPALLLSVSDDMSGAVIAPSSAGTVPLSDWLVPSFGEPQAASRRTAGSIGKERRDMGHLHHLAVHSRRLTHKGGTPECEGNAQN